MWADGGRRPCSACHLPTAALLSPAVTAVEQVVGVLKKEAMKTQSRELEKGAEYRQLLVQVGTAGQAGWLGACACAAAAG